MLAVILVRFRAFSYSWLPSGGLTHAILGLNTPALLASIALIAYFTVSIIQWATDGRQGLSICEALLCAALFLAVPWLDARGLDANTALIRMGVEAAPLVGESITIESQSPWACTAPYTVPEHRDTWQAAYQILQLRAVTSDRTSVPSEPYATAVAERVQALIGSGDWEAAEIAIEDLRRVDNAGPLWRLFQAKLEYARGDAITALSTVQDLPEGSLDADSGLSATYAAFDAYYSAAVAAQEQEWGAALRLLTRYQGEGRDYSLVARVESDSNFDAFAESNEYAALKASLKR
jgi:hypothetical protein